jgi:hypothetical protein
MRARLAHGYPVEHVPCRLWLATELLAWALGRCRMEFSPFAQGRAAVHLDGYDP